ncbi:MAG: hypothetical protein LW630_08375 [Saprospiraceae bacterium]|jgi:hypothetical protein|nr:hypothetical protein [Saprospiraceae bacterium]
MKHLSLLVVIVLLASSQASGQQAKSCHLKNPLCFYGNDILTYLQALYNVQQYEKMIPFLTGPFVEKKDRDEIAAWIENSEFGYTFKRTGIRQLNDRKWSVTFRRTYRLQDQTFKITCVLEEGICRLYLDKQAAETIFLLSVNR